MPPESSDNPVNTLVLPAKNARLAAILCLAVGLFAGSRADFAVTRPDLFRATVALADRSEAGQNAAFQAALRAVLVRVTGRRAADQDPALAPLLSQARRFVQQYHPARDNQLDVAFDGAAIERWLSQNGQPVWGRERPSTFVWLAVQTGPQTGSVVNRDDTSELKLTLDAAAAARGIELIWPTAADLDGNRVDYAQVAGAAPGLLVDLARRLGGEGVLIGHANNASATATVRWIQTFKDRSSEVAGTTEGVDRAADVYAELFSASGSPVPVEIEVTGIDDVRDYAAVQGFLESLSFVSHVGVQAANGDALRFRLSVRGGIDSLQSALALGGPLEAGAAGDGGTQRFHLRR